MESANSPLRRSGELKLLVVSDGMVRHSRLDELASHLEAGDLLVVNDAATVPASLRGTDASGEPLEVRLTRQIHDSIWEGVTLGQGDWRQPTEKRPAPSRLKVKDAIIFDQHFSARVLALSNVSDRLMTLDFNLEGARLWQSLYEHGKPIQYSYMKEDLALWSVQNIYSSRPWAVEMPSAGHGLTWSLLMKLFGKGIKVVSLTHGAGLSSTGDRRIDAALPLVEQYEIPSSTMEAVAQTRGRKGNVIAVGTSVVRALESADDHLSGTTSLRIGEGYRPKFVDGLLTATHEVSESHYQLLRAFLPEETLVTMTEQLEENGYLTHEFGDQCLILRS